MLMMASSAPLGSVIRVCWRPRDTALRSIFVTKADVLPASQSARRVAMSLPESMRRPSSASSSVRDSPEETGTSGSPAALPAWYAASVWVVTAMVGPVSPPVDRGWSFKTT